MTIEFDSNVARLVTLASMYLAFRVVDAAWVLGYSVFVAVKHREDKAKAFKVLEDINKTLREGNEPTQSEKFDS